MFKKFLNSLKFEPVNGEYAKREIQNLKVKNFSIFVSISVTI